MRIVKRTRLRGSPQILRYRYGNWVVLIYDSGDVEWIWKPTTHLPVRED